MKIFDNKGMMIIPKPERRPIDNSSKLLVVRECYCHKGHTLMSRRAMFNGYEGILLQIKKTGGEGLIALSPIYGDKSRISLDVELEIGEILDLGCPVCHESLPFFSTCSCGAFFVSLFANDHNDFSNCIGVCNRVDCPNAVLQSEGKILSYSILENL